MFQLQWKEGCLDRHYTLTAEKREDAEREACKVWAGIRSSHAFLQLPALSAEASFVEVTSLKIL